MQVVLNETQLSDVWFNFEKPELSDAYANEFSEDQIQDALKKDAETFSEITQVPIQWLIDEYNRRK